MTAIHDLWIGNACRNFLVNVGWVRFFPERLRIKLVLLLSWPTRHRNGDLVFIIAKKAAGDVMVAQKGNGMRDIIFVSLENWDEVWRRNPVPLRKSSRRRFPEIKILFVAPARDVSNSVRRGRLSEIAGEAVWTSSPGLPEHHSHAPFEICAQFADSRALPQPITGSRTRARRPQEKLKNAQALALDQPAIGMAHGEPAQ